VQAFIEYNERRPFFVRPLSGVHQHDLAVFNGGDTQCFHVADRRAVAGTDPLAVDLNNA
jgi:hypothetical protein